MPEEGTAAPIEETPQEQAQTPEQETPESVTPDWESDDNPYRKRYEDIRPQFDRTNQEVAQYRQLVEAARSDDPEVRNAALQELGYEVADDDEPDTDDDFTRLARTVEQLQGKLSQWEQQEQTRSQQEAEISYLDSEFSRIEKAESREFSDEDIEIIAALADRMRDDQGRPNVEGAYKKVLAYGSEVAKRQRQAKRAPQVHSGKAGKKQPDLSNKDARIRYGADVLEAGRE